MELTAFGLLTCFLHAAISVVPAPSAGPVKFEQDAYVVNVTENGAGGELLARVRAVHTDRLPLVYTMLAHRDQRSAGALRIDPRSGDVRTTRPLDRETMAVHEVLIRAAERGSASPNAAAEVSLTVHVLDVQDNAPVFETSAYAASVAEDLPVDRTVLHVHAHDADSGRFGTISYSLEAAEGAGATPEDDVADFSINQRTGRLLVAKPLDRERRESYRFIVRATDRADDLAARRSGTAVINVEVTDVNDNKPQFSSPIYRVSILENATFPREVLTVSATDTDAGENGRVRYSLVAGGEGLFELDYTTGALRLISGLDFRRAATHTLLVRAQDAAAQPLFSTAEIDVNVEDVNDHAPNFHMKELRVSARENIPANSEISRVQAYDGDTGENARITYTLQSRHSNLPVAVEPRTGRIYTTKSLDREVHSLLHFDVRATDAGHPPLTGSLAVTLDVTDENDNAPEFEKKFYNSTVDENAALGSLVVRVKAVDPDESSTVTYTLLSGNEDDTFVVLPMSGEAVITLNKPLDYAKNSRYMLNIKAFDEGGNYDTTMVHVYVADVNSAPRFDPHPFTVRVAESANIGSTLAVLRARDDDADMNAKLTYTLTNDDRLPFSVVSDTGVISVSGKLDRETRASYSLKLTATDKGKPPLSASTQLEVLIDDVNDNAPKFEKLNYTISVSEDVNKDTSILHVRAMDADDGDSARLVYHIEPETNPDNIFFIDPSSGTIRTSGALDREKNDRYELSILAKDSGEPPLTGRTTVIVNVADVNDNPPRFAQHQYDLHVVENSPIGSLVGRLHAIDPDTGVNARVRYSIAGGSDMQLFELAEPADGQPGCLILTRTELDHETRQEYRFQIRAASGDLSSLADVLVHVSDVNDNRPTLADFHVALAYARGEAAVLPAPVARVPATDRDGNATLNFFVQPNELVDVDPRTGDITLKRHMHTNRQLEQALEACVSDGPNTVCSQMTVLLMPVDHSVLSGAVTVRVTPPHGASHQHGPDHLLTPVGYDRLRSALATMGPYAKSDVRLFSIMSEREAGAGHSVLNATFAVRQGHQFVSSAVLRELVHRHSSALAAIAGARVEPYEHTFCAAEPCVNYQVCMNALKFGRPAGEWYASETFLFRPLNPVATFSCQCAAGSYASSVPGADLCDVPVNQCWSSPCRGHNATCVPNEFGYSCVCPEDRTGPNCDIPLTGSVCAPGVCKGGAQCTVTPTGRLTCRYCPFAASDATADCRLRARRFQHGAHVALPTIKRRNRFRLSVSVATPSSDALLLYNGRYESSGADWIALRLIDGRAQFELCLGDPNSVTVAQLPLRVDDGLWHTVHVDYSDMIITMWLDDCDVELWLRYADSLSAPKCAVRLKHVLPARCDDPNVPCFRFLDLTGPLYLGAAKRINVAGGGTPPSYNGCLRDLTLDGQMMDLSDEAIIANHRSEAGCSAKSDGCNVNTDDRKCNGGSCKDVWNGHRCLCNDDFKSGRHCEIDTAEAVTLSSAQSYVVWTPASGAQPSPMHVHFEFRTRALNTQPLGILFEDGNFMAVHVRSGHAGVSISENEFQTVFPNVADGEWHAIDIRQNAKHINFTVDFLHHSTFTLQAGPFYSSISAIFSGSWPSAKSSAQPYVGCIKAVTLGEQQLRVRSPHGHYQTSRGCSPANKCNRGSRLCPKHASCEQQWDSYNCKCNVSYIGANCTDVCQLHGAPCLNGGFCVHASTPRGYLCRCPKEYHGDNCEMLVPPTNEKCPDGWWGSPLCRPCDCSVKAGENAVCDKNTGRCQCQADHYRRGAQCFPCACFYPTGADSQSCEPETGQCKCRGDAIGRQCDRCRDPRAGIEPHDGTCVVWPQKCPMIYEHDLLWPATTLGDAAPTSCPHGARGLASRMCDAKSGLWHPADLRNCTGAAFSSLLAALVDMDNSGTMMDSYGTGLSLAAELHNATRYSTHDDGSSTLFANDVYVGYRLLLKLLKADTRDAVMYLADEHFVPDLFTTASALLDPSLGHWWSQMWRHDAHKNPFVHLLATIDSYGGKLANLHANGPDLKPFAAGDMNLVGALDHFRCSSGQTTQLPKFENVVASARIQTLASDAVQIRIGCGSVQHTISTFYAIAPSMAMLEQECRTMCISSAVVSIALSAPKSNKDTQQYEPKPTVTIFFQLLYTASRIEPRCASWDQQREEWSTTDCGMVMYNRTHVGCVCSHLSTFAVLMRPKPATSSPLITARLVCTVVATLLLLAAAARALASCCHTPADLEDTAVAFGAQVSATRHYVQLLVALTTAAHVVAFAFVHRVKYAPLWCGLVSAVLHWSSVCVCAAHLLYILCVYRSITDWGRPRRRRRAIGTMPSLTNVTAGAAVVGLPASLALVALMLGRRHAYSHVCWLSAGDPYVWTMFIPVFLLVLMSLYVLITCYMISLNREWKTYLAKLRLCRSLTSYACASLATLIYIALSWLDANSDPIDGSTGVVPVACAACELAVAALVALWIYLVSSESTRDGDGSIQGGVERVAANGPHQTFDQMTAQKLLTDNRPDSPYLPEHLAPIAADDSTYLTKDMPHCGSVAAMGTHSPSKTHQPPIYANMLRASNSGRSTPVAAPTAPSLQMAHGGGAYAAMERRASGPSVKRTQNGSWGYNSLKPVASLHTPRRPHLIAERGIAAQHASSPTHQRTPSEACSEPPFVRQYKHVKPDVIPSWEGRHAANNAYEHTHFSALYSTHTSGGAASGTPPVGSPAATEYSGGMAAYAASISSGYQSAGSPPRGSGSSYCSTGSRAHPTILSPLQKVLQFGNGGAGACEDEHALHTFGTSSSHHSSMNRAQQQYASYCSKQNLLVTTGHQRKPPPLPHRDESNL